MMLMVPSILQLTDDEIYDVYRNELGRLEDTRNFVAKRLIFLMDPGWF